MTDTIDTPTPSTTPDTVTTAAPPPSTPPSSASSENTVAVEKESSPSSVQSSYQIDTESDSPETTTAAETEESTQPYSIQWPDGYEVSPSFSDITNTVAQEAGLDSKAAGVYTARVLDALNEAELKNMEKQDADLKTEWGSDYNSRMKECKTFLARHAKSAGLSNSDIAVLQSPKGFKLIYSFMAASGEQPAHVGTPTATAQSWANEAMNNPSHPDYNALRNLDDPRHEDVARRWYKAQGARI